MKINSIRSKENGRHVEADLEFGADRWTVYYQSDDLPLTGNLEAFIALALPPAMKHHEPIQTQGEASERFLENLRPIQDFFLQWKPRFARVELNGISPTIRPTSGEGRVGLFFSAGLDSFYTFLKHREEITDLIFLHGFDFQLHDTWRRDRASEAIHKIAANYRKRVLEIETNAKSFTNATLPGHPGWGALLVSIGHLLFPYFSRIYIATGHTYDILDIMEGSHPALDPLWSTEALEFIHDGLEANRVEKAALVAKSEVALQTLRVCIKNRPGSYNCGLCEKCLRTMMCLRIVGALDQCTVFDQPLDLERVSRMQPIGYRRIFLSEILEECQKRQIDPELETALLQALAKPGLIKSAIRRIKKLHFRIANRKRL